MWEEFFGDVRNYARLDNKAIAGVANTGQEDTWCGHIFSQANWYAFGRLAWEPTLTSEQIAEQLCLSLPTIKWYRKRLRIKFDVGTTVEMIRKALLAGLI